MLTNLIVRKLVTLSLGIKGAQNVTSKHTHTDTHKKEQKEKQPNNNKFNHKFHNVRC